MFIDFGTIDDYIEQSKAFRGLLDIAFLSNSTCKPTKIIAAPSGINVIDWKLTVPDPLKSSCRRLHEIVSSYLGGIKITGFTDEETDQVIKTNK